MYVLAKFISTFLPFPSRESSEYVSFMSEALSDNKYNDITLNQLVVGLTKFQISNKIFTLIKHGQAVHLPHLLIW